MDFRERLSHFRAMALQLAGVKQGGFFIPYPYAASVPQGCSPYPAMLEAFAAQEDQILAHLAAFVSVLPDFRKAIDQGAIPWEEGGMFPKLDAFAAYGVVRSTRPRQILEMGSGASSHVMARALSDNGEGKLTCIDPAPRRSIADLGATLVTRVLGEDDVAMLADFQAGDILFIDSSHVMLPRMDVDIQFNRMFPALPKGAIVHVHDIFLPDDYPATWNRRHFSEQNALFGWIASGFFEVVFPGYHMASRKQAALKAALGDLMPQDPVRNAGSIWLRKT